MLNTKLILVEGIPGSGKSTITEFVSNELSKNGIGSKPYFEWTENHPIVVDDEEWNTHDKLESLNTYIQLNNQNWSKYIAGTNDKSNISIFDCSFIQNPVNAFILLLNEKKAVILEFYKNLYSLIGCLNPMLIYLRQDNVETTFNRALNSRPKEWSKFFIDYTCCSEYGKKNCLLGVDGVINFLKCRQSIEDEVFENFPFTKLLIDNSDFNLEKCKDKISRFISKCLQVK